MTEYQRLLAYAQEYVLFKKPSEPLDQVHVKSLVKSLFRHVEDLSRAVEEAQEWAERSKILTGDREAQ